MAWIQLIVASASEIIWVSFLKQTHGFTKLVPSVIVTIFAIASYHFLSLATRSLPVGTAYAIWTGLGTIGVVSVAIISRGESADLLRMICIGLILTGVMGLRLTTPVSLD